MRIRPGTSIFPGLRRYGGSKRMALAAKKPRIPIGTLM
jgi:hypothetical protein